jgi:hypothetical protein
MESLVGDISSVDGKTDNLFYSVYPSFPWGWVLVLDIFGNAT